MSEDHSLDHREATQIPLWLPGMATTVMLLAPSTFEMLLVLSPCPPAPVNGVGKQQVKGKTSWV